MATATTISISTTSSRPAGPRLLAAYAVEGDSMSPTLCEGDWLLGVSTRLLPPAPGRIVVFRQQRAGGGRSIKRVAAREAGGWFVLGDNPPRSSDSRVYGAVADEQIEAVVIARYGPLGRLAWLLA